MAQTTVDGSIPSAEMNVKTESTQPNVRHIPIFVEGRDEPLINKNIDITPDTMPKPAPTINDSPGSIFNRVKNIPVRKPMSNFDIPVTASTNIGGVGGIPRSESPARPIPIPVTTNVGGGLRSESPGRTIPISIGTNDDGIRAESPGRTIPIKVEHVQNKSKPVTTNNTTNSIPNANQLNENARSRSSSPMPPKPPMDSITKIQLIQKEILGIMERVDKFKGTSRKDKEYLYLDEMLTQNLLKLDTIDTEGKDNIKAARKEAINCINKCIAVLEAKVDAMAASGTAVENTTATTQNNPSTNQSNNNAVNNSENISQEKSCDEKLNQSNVNIANNSENGNNKS